MKATFTSAQNGGGSSCISTETLIQPSEDKRPKAAPIAGDKKPRI